jgi:hypothetical protein
VGDRVCENVRLEDCKHRISAVYCHAGDRKILTIYKIPAAARLAVTVVATEKTDAH